MKELDVITIRNGVWTRKEPQETHDMTEWIRERAAAMEMARTVRWMRIRNTMIGIGAVVTFLVLAWRTGG